MTSAKRSNGPTSNRTRRPASETSSRSSKGKEFTLPASVSHAELLWSGRDDRFRETIYLMVLTLNQMLTFREAFGRSLELTGSQFAVLMGTAYQQKADGVTIRALADHVMLAPTHVTTEVGRLIRKGLLIKRPNKNDGRSVLVSLSPRGEAALEQLSPYLRQINNILFERISRAEFETVSRVFRTVSQNVARAAAEVRNHEALKKQKE